MGGGIGAGGIGRAALGGRQQHSEGRQRAGRRSSGMRGATLGRRQRQHERRVARPRGTRGRDRYGARGEMEEASGVGSITGREQG